MPATDQPGPAPFTETADIETASAGYAARFAGPTGRWMLDLQQQTVEKLLPPAPANLLDVGGGHGQLAIPLCKKGYAVTVLGSDASCGIRIADAVSQGQCRFVTGDLIAPPFADESFDVALSVRLLPHCEDWPALIAGLCRVARRSVIADYPVTQGLNALAPALFGAKKKMEGNTRPWRAFSDEELRAEFARHGYQPHRRHAQFFLPMALHRMLKCRPLSQAMESCFATAGLTRRWGSPVIAEWRKGKSLP